MSINTIELFLAHALRLEEDSAIQYEEMADALDAHHKGDVSRLFRKMAHYSRLHLAECEGLAAGKDIPRLKAWEYQWPGDNSPENAPADEADYAMNDRDALLLALKGEQGGLDFYQGVADSTTSTEIRDLALEFVAEETEHVDILKDWIKRTPGTERLDDLDPPQGV